MNQEKQRIVVATHNKGKVAEIERILSSVLGDQAQRFEFVTSGELGLPDPVEDGVTFSRNALLKARDAAARSGLPAMADDSGLIVDVMGKAPGILSARWSGKHGDDAANNALLLEQLADIPDQHRGARFCCACALVLPAQTGGSDSQELVEEGRMVGRIIRQPRGQQGFGYDPLFVPDDQSLVTEEQKRANQGLPLTSAQMTAEQKNAISHRGAAIRAMAAHFSEVFC
ncbi:dITP/XTP pyrophosphatase [Parascardovia denticolens IPLA 20019]|uniref:non-canonical purine NTP pyrophosphatase n=1 Tax=Parascardovia denticolens TaxID=78258 RepID=UPI000266B4C2|nr:non-canonical purine NTP pyrophosphatase [Parascardovia denticolens]EIT88989.1 dITP/XTP pyrophosphatase [Parascardovia denticolens IPLA 20019]